MNSQYKSTKTIIYSSGARFNRLFSLWEHVWAGFKEKTFFFVAWIAIQKVSCHFILQQNTCRRYELPPSNRSLLFSFYFMLELMATFLLSTWRHRRGKTKLYLPLTNNLNNEQSYSCVISEHCIIIVYLQTYMCFNQKIIWKLIFPFSRYSFDTKFRF